LKDKIKKLEHGPERTRRLTKVASRSTLREALKISSDSCDKPESERQGKQLSYAAFIAREESLLFSLLSFLKIATANLIT